MNTLGPESKSCGTTHCTFNKTFATAANNLAVHLTIAIPFFFNIALKDILKLQCVQNCLASVVTRSPRLSYSVPLLRSLAPNDITLFVFIKMCTITYQALSSKQPAYIHCSLLQDGPDSFNHLILIYFLFLLPVLRQA